MRAFAWLAFIISCVACSSSNQDVPLDGAATDSDGAAESSSEIGLPDSSNDAAGEDSASDVAADGDDQEPPPPPPNPDNPKLGEVVISEVLPFGAMLGSTFDVGEYVELFNASDRTVKLDGCVLQSGAGAGIEAIGLASVTMAPKSYAVLRSASSGITFDYPTAATFDGITLGNSDPDWISLSCGEDEIDGVAWNGSTAYPASLGVVAARVSRERSTASLSGGTPVWCDGTSSHTMTRTLTGDSATFTGSPALANACP